MTSDPSREAYVWVWLPDVTQPVVAGRLAEHGSQLVFNYGRSYLERAGAVPLYLPELPLQAGELPLLPGLSMPGCIRDAAPDAWGRRVILNRRFGAAAPLQDAPSELLFLLNSGSDRIGALDFQHSATQYQERAPLDATLEELMASAERVEQGVPLSAALDQALHHGTSIGGARPKAMITADHHKYVAKFSSTSDIYSVVKAEFIAMRLAAHAGLQVAPVTLAHAAGKDVLLIERFDRRRVPNAWTRRSMVSVLTILGLDEMMARYASYQDLAEIIRQRFTDPQATLHELFGRMVFNILCGNTDDHARNHAAFWDGGMLTLTPAYDICPQGRIGQEASQAMRISGEDNLSRLSTCLDAAHSFQLSQGQAMQLMEVQMRVIADHWLMVCEQAQVAVVDRNLFWGRQFMNPYAFADLQGAAAGLRVLADELRGKFRH